jgi:hypothetical protein
VILGFFCFDFGSFFWGSGLAEYRLLAIIRFMLLFGGWVVGGSYVVMQGIWCKLGLEIF